MIAHRLSTIKNADVIYGIKDGRVAESGTHDQLIAKQGLYYDLVTNQTRTDDTVECGKSIYRCSHKLSSCIQMRSIFYFACKIFRCCESLGAQWSAILGHPK